VLKVDIIKKGSKRWFEYHCLESLGSLDAELWYRSHRKVTVGACCNREYAKYSQEERYKEGIPLAYHVVFEDGYKGDAMEDELMQSRKQFNRPNPPKKPKVI
jgi:hypothetical protein